MKLSVGDGLVTQIPALIVSLAAGLLVSREGPEDRRKKPYWASLKLSARALRRRACFLRPGDGSGFAVLSVRTAGGDFEPFHFRRRPRRKAEVLASQEAHTARVRAEADEETKQSVKVLLKLAGIELCLGKQIAVAPLPAHAELGQRVAKMRRKFAKQYGFIVPEIKALRRYLHAAQDLSDQGSRGSDCQQRIANSGRFSSLLATGLDPVFQEKRRRSPHSG